MKSRNQVLHMSVEDYLKSEETSRVRREYVNGRVFAMGGATDAHNIICGNMFAPLHSHLADSGCRVYMNDMKVRIESVNSFYYPDIMVTCESYVAKSVFKDAPTLIIEVLSPSTRQIDRREKLQAYQRIESLNEYVVVYQDRQQIEIYRRNEARQWDMTVVSAGDNFELQALSNKPIQFSMSTIYKDLGLPKIVREGDEDYDLDLDFDVDSN